MQSRVQGGTSSSIAEKMLPPLVNARNYDQIVTRFAPNPDFVLHLGSVRPIILSHDYASQYQGKFLLRFEDTDPRLKKSTLEYYDAIREDLRWLGCTWKEEYIQSDRMQIYYDYAYQLLEQGQIFVCTCERDKFSTRVSAGQPCPCRSKSPNQNLDDWKRMLDGGFQEGGAVVRVKTDLAHPNPAVRDWPALRIIDSGKYPHQRVGSQFRVWPLYNWSAGIDDHLMGVTHVFRGKEHLANAVRQSYLYKHLGWSYPEVVEFGRLKVEGTNLSKSWMVKQLEQGLVDSYADPRLATLAALRRRGYSPAAFRKITYEIGPRPVDASLSWDNVNATDRKEIDKDAHRYHFVNNPVQLVVENVPGPFEAQLPVHPERPDLGKRTLKVGTVNGTAQIWLSRGDLEILAKSKVVRLMELFNVEVSPLTGGILDARFHSQEYETARALRAPLIQWLPEEQQLPCDVIMPTATKTSGFVEDNILRESAGTVIQMVRFGFGRIDRTGDSGLTVYFAHR